MYIVEYLKPNAQTYREKSQKLEKLQFLLDTLQPPLTLDLLHFSKNCDFSNFWNFCYCVQTWTYLQKYEAPLGSPLSPSRMERSLGLVAQ